MANLEGEARSIAVDTGRGASSVSAARLCASLCRGVTVWRNAANARFVREKSSCAYSHAAGRRFGPEGAGNGVVMSGRGGIALRSAGLYFAEST